MAVSVPYWQIAFILIADNQFGIFKSSLRKSFQSALLGYYAGYTVCGVHVYPGVGCCILVYGVISWCVAFYPDMWGCILTCCVVYLCVLSWFVALYPGV